jgi:hypothetical protein
MVEECEKIVEIKKIAKSKDLFSAVTVISKENERNTEEINNLKDIIKQLATTAVDRPIEEKM